MGGKVRMECAISPISTGRQLARAFVAVPHRAPDPMTDKEF
jgi:hypothetical protein